MQRSVSLNAKHYRKHQNHYYTKQQSPMPQFIKYWLPLIVYCLLIFVQSSFPSPINEPDVPFFDKYLHFFAYAILGALFYRAYVTLRRGAHRSKIVVFSILSAGLYGISDEIHQYFVPGRHADMMDATVDFVGAVCGVICYRYFTARRSAAAGSRIAD